LEQALDRTLTADSGASGRAAVVAAAAAVIGRAIEAAAKCEDGPSDALLRESLEALYQRSPRNQTVRGVIEVARKHGAELVALRRGQGAQGVADRIIRLATMMSAIHSQDQFNATTYFQNALGTQYAVAMDLLRSHEEDPRSLQWLERTSVHAGCLGLWSETAEDLVAGADPTLAIVGAFDRDGTVQGTRRPAPGLNETVAASLFPPAQLLALAEEDPEDIVFVLPVKVRSSDWGLLSIVGHIGSKATSGRETLNQWAALLTVALDHQANVASLEEQRLKVESLERERDLVEDIRLSAERYALAAEAASGGLWD
jgi:hypothetical protein